MKKIFSTLTIIVFLISFGACGPYNGNKAAKDVQANPTDYAKTITAEDLKTALYTYASDEFEGRETGQPGQKKAVNFIKDHYMKYGVEAAKGNNDYFQNVPLELMSVPAVTISVNGKGFKNIDDFVSVESAKSGSLSSKEVVYAGFGIEDENYSDYKNIDVKNKIVLIKSGEPKNEDGTNTITGTEEASKWSNFRQQFASKRDLANQKGASAVLFYYPEVYAMAANRFGRSSGRMALKNNEDSMYYLMINKDLAKALLSDIDTNNTASTITTNLNLDYKNNSESINSENVAAFIKGSEKPDEVIVISAHLDHEGVKDGKVYNGADDDGSGTVAVIEIARAFAKARKDGNGPKRSLLFLNVIYT